MSFWDDLFGTKKPEPITQTNTTTQPQGTQQLNQLALPILQHTLKHIPKISQPAALTADQLQAQQMAKAAATGSVAGIAQGAAGANNFLTNPDILQASSNPALQSYMDAAIRPITENFTNSVLPNIRGEAISAGGLGGSRQGLAEGNASGGYLRQVGDTSANIANAGYNTGLGAMISGAQMAPQTAGLQLAPSEIFGAVGQQNQDQTNAGLAVRAANQFMPWQLASNAIGIGNSIPGGSATTTVTGAPGTTPASPFSTILGGLTSGLGFLSGIPGASKGLSSLSGIFG